jgi:hypothetical protein
MPVFSPSERFNPSVTYTKDVVKALHSRAIWWLSTRSAAEIDEEYVDMMLYLWVQPTETAGEYTAHFAMSDVSLSDIPEDAFSYEFSGKQSLRAIEEDLRTPDWPRYLHSLSRRYFREKCALTSTLDALRDLSGYVTAWLAAPSVEDFDTSTALYGADRYTLYFNFDKNRWSYEFDVPELAAMDNMKGCARYVIDLRDYGVVSHQDAIDFLETEAYDKNLKMIALVHQLASAHDMSRFNDRSSRH